MSVHHARTPSASGSVIHGQQFNHYPTPNHHAAPVSAPAAQQKNAIDLRQRPVPHVPPPAAHKPTDADFFVGDGARKKVNHEYLKKHFFQEGRLTERQALHILDEATNILAREENMVPVKSPVTICGDIHGQYYDLMKMFDVGGSLQDSTYLFLGDYVDRGDFGIEVRSASSLHLPSVQFPLVTSVSSISTPSKSPTPPEYTSCEETTNAVTSLNTSRSRKSVSQHVACRRTLPDSKPLHTFTPSPRTRLGLHKYSENVYEACLRSFCALPVAALVDGKFFCVHGGISPQLVHLSDLANINRHQEPGSHGLLCDLLWADPISNFGQENEPTANGPGLERGTTFTHNATRGCSYFYTYDAVCQFLDRNGLLTVIRGHEAQDAGYTMYRKTPKRNFPSVITIFSAPNYLDVYHNRGAILKYANKNITIRQYNSTSHPYWLPNFMDAFTWSLPFVGLKITEMLLAILSICSQEELESDSEEEGAAAAPEDLAARRQLIKRKILAVGRMQKVFQLLREEAENTTELETEGIAGASTAVSRGGADALTVQGTRINRSIRTFDDARRSDIANERLPEFDHHRGAIFPVPSMRLTSRRSSEGMDMEDLIKRTMEEENEEGGVVERLAERIARGRSVTGKPAPLKRFDTT